MPNLRIFDSLIFSLFLLDVQGRVVPRESEPELHSDHIFKPEEIIDLPVGRFPDPDCRYTVHLNKKNGPIAQGEVRIGDPLYHEWTCSYGQLASSMYCMIVNNCTVAENRKAAYRVPILDEFGCSLFPSILPHVHYGDDLEAYLPVHAFSLDIDKAAVFFECNIKLLLKLNGICRRPTCVPIEQFQNENR
ncbi:unnamed protein product, partial [Mesorhabditis belari]|uniref:ZP domain-containing protein n=1 Tax=Mesorhabditis belari TaxID=2138241 RepID=A0AAF3J7V6_9BILA